MMRLNYSLITFVVKKTAIRLLINGGLVEVNLEHLIGSILKNPLVYESIKKIPFVKGKEGYNASVRYSLSIIY